MSRIAVVGGGITGLAAAYYLTRGGGSCTLVEPSPQLGGVIRTENAEGCVIEAGPDSFIAQKPWALELIRELGLGNEVIRSNDHLRKTYIVRRRRLVPMPSGLQLLVPTEVLPLLRSPLLSFPAKCRMALELLRRPPGEAAAQQDRSAADFIRDHFGDEAVRYLAEPLLAGVYGGDAAELSAGSVLPRFVEFERRYGSITRGVLAARREMAGRAGQVEHRGSGTGGAKPEPALFLSLREGMQQLIQALAKQIAGRVPIISSAAHRLEKTVAGYRLSFEGASAEFDQVILGTPAYTAATLLRGVDEPLAALLYEIRYHSSITMALGYARENFPHPLNGFGFLIPKTERRLLTACTWVGTKFPHRVPENRILLRCFIGAGPDDAPLSYSDASLVASAQKELAPLMGVKQQPLFTRVSRWPRAMAQYTVGHAQRISAINARLARLPGLHLAGNAYTGIGIPDCIHTAQLAAAAALAHTSHPDAASLPMKG